MSAIEIPGLDTEQGIRLSGGTPEFYRKALAAYCSDAAGHILALSKPVDEIAPGEFITKVHSLKSALAIIGAVELSAEAASLEAAGKAGNTLPIKERLPSFLSRLLQITQAVTTYLDGAFKDKTRSAPEGEGGGTDAAETAGLFAALRDALAKSDVPRIDRTIASLEQLPLDRRQRRTVELISNAALRGDFARASEILIRIEQGSSA
jgi:HPt (histidine-containing phosphotransfer) domain-containing protein